MGRTRSSLGPHWAGTGITGQTSQEFDEQKVGRGVKVYKPGMLPTDRFDSSDKGKKAFDEYCKQQSGEVVTYNIKDLEE